MTEPLFAIDRRNRRDCQSLFRGRREQEYYSGDYSVEDGAIIDVRATRRAAGPSSVILLTSATQMSFRRTRRHIRDDGIDLSVLWFVKRGSILFSNQLGNRTAQPGDLLVTRSTAPFYIECRPDGCGRHDVLHVTVPTHLLRGFFDCDGETGLFLPARRGEIALADTMLTAMFESEAELSEKASRAMVEAAFAVIGDALRGEKQVMPIRQSVSEKRFRDVLRFVEVHLSDPGLSMAMVARGCAISPRRLSALLQQNRTSFSRLIWDRRLEQAKSWMARASAQHVSISEIAYAVGFKSPAHFSRMFKRTYLSNPSDYRAASLAEAAMPMARADMAGAHALH